MTKQEREQIRLFADVCAARGKDERDYDVEAATTNKQKATISHERTMLIAEAFNGNEKVRVSDPTQRKWGIWAWVEKDEDAPLGFRLAFDGCNSGVALARLGARPLFLNPDDGKYAFHQFREEFERAVHYQDLAYGE